MPLVLDNHLTDKHRKETEPVLIRGEPKEQHSQDELEARSRGRAGPHALEGAPWSEGLAPPDPCLSLLPAGPGKAVPCLFPNRAGRLWAPGHGQRLQVC